MKLIIRLPGIKSWAEFKSWFEREDKDVKALTDAVTALTAAVTALTAAFSGGVITPAQLQPAVDAINAAVTAITALTTAPPAA